MKKKLSLSELTVKSFTTSIDDSLQQTLKGGNTDDNVCDNSFAVGCTVFNTLCKTLADDLCTGKTHKTCRMSKKDGEWCAEIGF